MLGAAMAAALTLGGLASAPAFSGSVRLSRHADFLLFKDGDGRRKKRHVGARENKRKDYVCTTGMSRRRKLRTLRKMWLSGEAARKRSQGPDMRPDKYLHSHARRKRAQASSMENNGQ
ncbi:hypothetical protein [Parvibaculum sp.]|uniref:hypothetical protein n=1 Tax=Parvibaculum sp. TaxID=2024848 RepID=UPI001DA24AE8|nr:hypothetical protein [Parvibaculum sp.]MBX3490872.1 hypothetical protein [Parvibaculum sp.]